MNIHQTFISFFLMVQGGTVGRLGADGAVWTGTVGESITGTCYFRIAGSKKRFCKKTCDEGTILIETDQTDHTDHKGRYSLHYEYKLFKNHHLNVTIRDLTKADSGRYTCQVVRNLAPDSSEEIELIVEDATTTTATMTTVKPTVRPSLPSPSAAATPTVTEQSLNSTQFPTSAQSIPWQLSSIGSGVLLYAGLVLLFLIVILAAAVIIFWRNSKPKKVIVQLDENEMTPVYEEIGDETTQNSPPAVSIIYSSVSFTKKNEAETTDIYSLATSPTSCTE